jgi:ankyrin repeat protein
MYNVYCARFQQNGMTPLMQAAYKGKHEICRLLIDKGADVNCANHEHKYSPLMFACLAGNTEYIIAADMLNKMN